jgi:hypothetical protein
VRDDYVLHGEVRDAGGNLLTGQPRPIFAAAGQPETLGLIGDNPLRPGDVIDDPITLHRLRQTRHGGGAGPGRIAPAALTAIEPDRLPADHRIGLQIGDQFGHRIAAVSGDRSGRAPSSQVARAGVENRRLDDRPI